MLRDPWTIAHVLARKIFHREDASFPVHPVDPRRKGFCHAMASRPARETRLSIKTGTIERPTSPFAHRVPVTCYKTRKRISPSVSVTRRRPNSRVPSVVSAIPTIFFPSLSTRFSKGGERPGVVLVALLTTDKSLLRRGLSEGKKAGLFPCCACCTRKGVFALLAVSRRDVYYLWEGVSLFWRRVDVHREIVIFDRLQDECRVVCNWCVCVCYQGLRTSRLMDAVFLDYATENA